ncbi:MAG: LysM peptidoglycan-binding domain-containing protein [Desulfatibacillaceae bacterium]
MSHTKIISLTIAMAAALALVVSGCVSPPGRMPAPDSARNTKAPAPTETVQPQKTEETGKSLAKAATGEECPETELSDSGLPVDDPALDANGGYDSAPEPAGPAVHDKAPRIAKSNQELLDEALEICDMAQDYWQKGEMESAFEALDQAYDLILAVESDGDPRLIQQKDDLRYMISRRILEIYASRHTVATGNHNAIPLVMNEHVKAELKRFTGPEKRFFIESYRRSGLYRPYIVEQLKKAGLPEELSWLPLIESGFKDRAMSRARALGLWQFIASTGYKFGLSRDQYVDERLDPEEATLAAIAYLKELHGIFGDWTTCLAAYNCGEGKVLRTIRSQNVNYLDNFWDLYQRLPRETARYVPRFLAALHIIENPEKYGMELCEPLSGLEYERITLAKRLHLKDVAKVLGVEESTLKLLNPQLRHHVTPPSEFVLRVPPAKSEVLMAKVQELTEYTPHQPAYVHHRIRRGETLSTIARRYGVSSVGIARANNISLRSIIVAGRTLKIPMRGGGTTYTASSTAVRTESTTHRVRRGDSLWNLARRYGTTVAAIQRTNGLSGSRLNVGQSLTIPANASGATPDKNSSVYVVRRGDSPYTIARRHDMGLNRFLTINQLTRGSRIYPGQKVYVE